MSNFLHMLEMSTHRKSFSTLSTFSIFCEIFVILPGMLMVLTAGTFGISSTGMLQMKQLALGKAQKQIVHTKQQPSARSGGHSQQNQQRVSTGTMLVCTTFWGCPGTQFNISRNKDILFIQYIYIYIFPILRDDSTTYHDNHD